jgi:hypothetical protein
VSCLNPNTAVGSAEPFIDEGGVDLAGETFTISRGRAERLGDIVEQSPITLQGLDALLHQAQAQPFQLTFAEYERLHAAKLAGDKAAKQQLELAKQTAWFVCASFKSTTRNKSELDLCTAIVGDADQPGTTREKLVARLDALNVSYLVVTSTSHGCGGQARYRVVLPLATPIPAERYRSAWESINAHLGSMLDPNAKDPTRLSYMPRIPTGAAGHEVIVRDDRQWLDASTLAEIEPPASETAPEVTPVTNDSEALTTISDDDLKQLNSALDFMRDKVADNGTWSEIGYGLLSLQSTRPVRELWYQFSSNAVGYEVGAPEAWWELHRGQQPRSDWRHILKMAGERGWRPTRVASVDAFAPVTDDPGVAPSAPPVTGAAGVPTSRFKPVIPNLAAPRPKWLVKHLLLEGSLAILFGRWGTGKTTVAIELSIAVARELPWHGRKVRGGKVVYVSCESPHGVRLRLSAALQDQGITLGDLNGNFLEIAARPHLLKTEDVQALIADLKPLGQTSLIVIDTLARAMAGTEENSAKDTAVLVANCQAISEATGACVLLIHHTGKDESRGMRGSSNLPASADTEIELERPDETANVRIAKLGKQRDAEDYKDLFNYELVRVTLGHDEDGDPITSTVVREIQPPSEVEVAYEAPKHPVRRAVWKTLDNAMRPMRVDELITSAAAELVHDPASGKRDRRREHASRAVEGMAQDGMLSRSPDGLYQIRRPDSAATVNEQFPPVISPAANDSNRDLVGEVSA